MWIAPQASIRDGQFEVIVVGDFSKFESLSQFKKIYKGTHLTLDKIEHFKAKHIKIESVEKVLLDVDGEQPGLLTATFNILPASLNLVV
jgi:diacylglycerol kinase family enzyme